MKNLIILVILFTIQLVSSQKLNLNNSIGFNFNDNDVKVYATSINSSNSFESKNLSIANSLNIIPFWIIKQTILYQGILNLIILLVLDLEGRIH